MKEGRKMKTIVLGVMLAAMCLVAACAGTTTGEMVKAELTMKQTKIAAATTTSALCQQGVMSKQDCAAALAAYQLSQVSSNTALSLLLANCTDADLSAQIQAAMASGFPVLSFGVKNE
jgi:uncharacterized lipoprotein YajG